MADYLVSFALFVVGVGVFMHYHLMANAITKSAAWVKFAVTAASSSGVGMAACGVLGEREAGLLFGLATSAFVLMVDLETWRCGQYVSETLRKAFEVREAHANRTRQIIYNIREPLRDLSDILTQSGTDEVRKMKEGQE